MGVGSTENGVCASTCHGVAYFILSLSLQRRDSYLRGKDEQIEAQGNCANPPKVTQLLNHRAWA